MINAVVRETSVTGPVLFQRVPDITVEIIITAKQQSTTAWEADSRNAADDVVVRIHGDLLVWSHVKHTTRGVVGTCRER